MGLWVTQLDHLRWARGAEAMGRFMVFPLWVWVSSTQLQLCTPCMCLRSGLHAVAGWRQSLQDLFWHIQMGNELHSLLPLQPRDGNPNPETSQ